MYTAIWTTPSAMRPGRIGITVMKNMRICLSGSWICFWKTGSDWRSTPADLRRYREKGGEIITIGSDAHRPQDLCRFFGRAEEILKDCGFRYYTVFEGRTPHFEKLD